MDNRSKKLLLTLIVVFLMLVMWQRFFAPGSSQVPTWVVLSGLGIVFSGYMWWQSSRKEQQEDQHWIEQEGRVFIRRMEEEREKKRVSS